jgi:hypothetical protein
MAFVIDGTTLSDNCDVIVNGTSLGVGGSVYLNGTKIFQRCYQAGNNTTLQSGTLADVTNESLTLLATFNVPNCGTYRINYYYTALWKGIRLYVYVNDVGLYNAIQVDGDVTQKTVSGYFDTNQLSAGDTIKIYQEPFHPWDGSGSGNYSIKVE